MFAAWCSALLACLSPQVAASGEGERLPKAGEPFRDCPECPLMVVVPPETLQTGSPESGRGQRSDEHQGPVSFAEPFAVGVYEVTFDEWDAAERDTVGPWLAHHPSDEGWGRGRRPVVNVSVKDAERYAEWLSWRTGQSYRLLKEHEWEHAARGGVATARYWREGEAEQCRYANGADHSAASRYSGLPVAQCDDGHATTAPVGSYAPNAFGLHDVLGNVWEWTGSCGSEDCDFMASVRGGSWLSAPRFLRTAQQRDNRKGARNYDIGFRVARTFAKREVPDE